MKKGKKIGLSLNKKVISNLQSSSITGGGTGGCPRGTNGTCTCAQTEFVDCGSRGMCTSRADCNEN